VVVPNKILIARFVSFGALLLCFFWCYKQPGFEPAVTAILIAGSLLVPLEGIEAFGPKSKTLDFRTAAKKFDAKEILKEFGEKTNGLRLDQGDLLVIRGPLGIAAIELKFRFGGRASYKWRFAEKARGSIVSGDGALFEQYGKNKRDGFLVTDLGGELFISAGPYKIEWSYRNFRSGWVYPKAADLDCYVLPKTALGAFRF